MNSKLKIQLFVSFACLIENSNIYCLLKVPKVKCQETLLKIKLKIEDDKQQTKKSTTKLRTYSHDSIRLEVDFQLEQLYIQ
jgi:hypothetical protein